MYGMFGSLPSVIPKGRILHRWLEELTSKHRITQISRPSMLGVMPVFVVHQPEDAKFVLANKDVFADRPEAPAGLSLLGEGNVLTLPTNDQWAKHRRLLSPLFTERFLREYTVMMNGKLNAFSAKLRAFGGKPVDVLPVVMSIALDFIGICGFGVDFKAIENVGTGAKRDFEDACTVLVEVG
jgi:cytochrome P450